MVAEESWGRSQDRDHGGVSAFAGKVARDFGDREPPDVAHGSQGEPTSESRTLGGEARGGSGVGGAIALPGSGAVLALSSDPLRETFLVDPHPPRQPKRNAER